MNVKVLYTIIEKKKKKKNWLGNGLSKKNVCQLMWCFMWLLLSNKFKGEINVIYKKKKYYRGHNLLPWNHGTAVKFFTSDLWKSNSFM